MRSGPNACSSPMATSTSTAPVRGWSSRWRFWPRSFSQTSFTLATRVRAGSDTLGVCDPPSGYGPDKDSRPRVYDSFRRQRCAETDYPREAMTVLQDLRHAVRLLLRNPAFSLTAVSLLALGIGANTVVFSLADGLLFRSLPYRDPDRLAFVQETGYFGV